MRKNLLKSTGVVSSMTMISRVLGFIRDMVIAQMFGAVAGIDAYLVAFKIPSFMRRLFAEGAFSQAFVPVLSEYKEKQSPEATREFISHMAGMLGLSLILVTIIAEIAAPLVVTVFAPGFHFVDSRFELATQMLHITFPYIFFISMTAFAGAILNTYGRFAIPAFTPVLLNISLICAATLLSPQMQQPVMALAWGVFIAGIVQLLFILPFVRHIKMLPRPRFRWGDSGVTKVLKLMVPALFGVSVAQISLLVDTLFASFLPIGSVTWLYYSDRITSLPLGVFGVAIATVVLPYLSGRVQAKSPEDYQRTLDWGIRLVLLIGIPSAIGLFILAGPILAALFGYAEFNNNDVLMTNRSMMAYAVGVPGFMLIKILASGYYAHQDIKTPVKIGIIALIVNMVLNLILIFPLAHAGLALATTLSSALNAFLLFWGLRKRERFKAQAGWGKYWLQLISASGTMAIILWFGRGSLAEWFSWGWQQRCLHLGLLIAAGGFVYFFVLHLMGLRWRELKKAGQGGA